MHALPRSHICIQEGTLACMARFLMSHGPIPAMVWSLGTPDALVTNMLADLLTGNSGSWSLPVGRYQPVNPLLALIHLLTYCAQTHLHPDLHLYFVWSSALSWDSKKARESFLLWIKCDWDMAEWQEVFIMRKIAPWNRRRVQWSMSCRPCKKKIVLLGI